MSALASGATLDKATQDAMMEDFLRWRQEVHDDYIARNRAVFLECPPDDLGVYVYTYYDGTGYPIYHGYTTNARQRAEKHLKEAPWASWIEAVRYRECSSPQSARRLEGRLQKKIESLCGASGRQLAYHGRDWSDLDNEFRINHVAGSCRLPGGHCDPDYLSRWLAARWAGIETGYE